MPATAVDPRLTWNLAEDIGHLFDYPFMVNALRAGLLVALTAGATGWFMVLRRQAFAGHTLAVIGFPGAAAALLVGASAPLGSFATCLAGAGALALIGSRGRRSRSGDAGDSAAIGLVQATALATGFLLLSRQGGGLVGIDALLFGSFIGVTDADVLRLVAVTAVSAVALAVLARPLLFASVDPDVAEARGVPVRRLSFGFLALLALAAASAAEITGALLVFALLVLPAATAQALTPRPGRSLLLATGLAVAVTWVGLGVAYYSPFPIGFWITTLAFGAYVLARLARGAGVVGRSA